VNKLSRQQELVLQTVENFVRDNGYSPTLADISSVMGVRKTSVNYALRRLETKGRIELAYEDDRLLTRGIFLKGQRDHVMRSVENRN